MDPSRTKARCHATPGLATPQRGPRAVKDRLGTRLRIGGRCHDPCRGLRVDRLAGVGRACRGAPFHCDLCCLDTKGRRRRVERRRREGGALSPCSGSACRRTMQPGKVERPAFGSEDPQKHFAVLRRRGLDETAFYAELASHISGRIGSNRDILLYVHGFNTSYDEARFRLAQIAADGRFGGVAVLYTWPAPAASSTMARPRKTPPPPAMPWPNSSTGSRTCQTSAACIFSPIRWAPGWPWKRYGKTRFPAVPTSTASSATSCSPHPTLT